MKFSSFIADKSRFYYNRQEKKKKIKIKSGKK